MAQATITLEEAQANLREVVHNLVPGEEIVITENNRPVARLVPAPAALSKQPRQLGTMRGTVLSMDHFDDPLEEFAEYR